MRLARIHSVVAAVSAALMLSLVAAPTTSWAGGATDMTDNPADEQTSPPAFDLIFLRPIGIVGAGISTLFFLVPIAPLVLITRPHEIAKPFDVMVVQPVRYVVADPLGHH